MSSMSKYGPPVKCEICQQTCAFNRSDLRIDGKLHCWLCKLSYKRALAKAKKSDIDKHRAKKRSADLDNALKTNSSLKMGNQGSSNRNNNNSNNSNQLSKSGSDLPEKVSKTSNSIIPHTNSDQVVLVTQLREQIATLQKKLQQKDNQLLQKDKEVSLYFAIALYFRDEKKNKFFFCIRD
jgi:FAM76 protein